MSEDHEHGTGDVPLWQIRNVQLAAVADVGIAMGKMGTDVAIETAEVVVIANGLRAGRRQPSLVGAASSA